MMYCIISLYWQLSLEDAMSLRQTCRGTRHILRRRLHDSTQISSGTAARYYREHVTNDTSFCTMVESYRIYDVFNGWFRVNYDHCTKPSSCGRAKPSTYENIYMWNGKFGRDTNVNGRPHGVSKYTYGRCMTFYNGQLHGYTVDDYKCTLYDRGDIVYKIDF